MQTYSNNLTSNWLYIKPNAPYKPLITRTEDLNRFAFEGRFV